jgi:hypothetical protein
MGLFDAFWKKKTTLDELEATASLNANTSSASTQQFGASANPTTNPYLSMNSSPGLFGQDSIQSSTQSSPGFGQFSQQQTQQGFSQNPQITIGSTVPSQSDVMNSISPSVASPYQQQSFQSSDSARASSRDMDLILSKLDTIRAELDNVKYAVGQLDKKVDAKKSYL